MKTLLAFSTAFLLLTVPGAAQRRGGDTRFVGTGGFGNVLFPGTGGPAASFASRLGATVAGRPIGSRNFGRSSGFIGGYPLYVGGDYVPAYAPDYSSQTQLAPQQYSAQPAPPVIINQYFGPPVAPEPITSVYQPYAERQQQQESSDPGESKYYLLAFKDHSVYSALAYWVEDKTLHYVTPHNTHNQASLDLVDVEFTKQLNANRETPFSLTPQPAR